MDPALPPSSTRTQKPWPSPAQHTVGGPGAGKADGAPRQASSDREQILLAGLHQTGLSFAGKEIGEQGRRGGGERMCGVWRERLRKAAAVPLSRVSAEPRPRMTPGARMAATTGLPWAGLTHIPGQGEGAEREREMEKLSPRKRKEGKKQEGFQRRQGGGGGMNNQDDDGSRKNNNGGAEAKQNSRCNKGGGKEDALGGLFSSALQREVAGGAIEEGPLATFRFIFGLQGFSAWLVEDL